MRTRTSSARSLGLIACARLGLSELELLDLLGTQDDSGQVVPLPRRHWTPFHLAAESALALRSGLLTFGHDYLRAAVERRWLASDAEAQSVRLHLADYFGSIPEPTDRKLDELPSLLRDTAQWERLKDLLADLPTFRRMRERERWKWELQGAWVALEPHFDPVEVYAEALAKAEPGLPPERLASLLNAVASFHLDAGRFAAAEPLFRRALEARERTLGPEHPRHPVEPQQPRVPARQHRGLRGGRAPLPPGAGGRGAPAAVRSIRPRSAS